jgi:hypothetical protein
MEWVRSCEEVRRFAPTIGQLGEWRALCEGGWTGSIPYGLPDSNGARQQISAGSHNEQATLRRPLTLSIENQDNEAPRRPVEHYKNEQNNVEEPTTSSRSTTTSSAEPFLSRKPSRNFSPAGKQIQTSFSNAQNPALEPPTAPFARNDKWTDTVGSATSLSSFPSPPTHIPVSPTAAEWDVLPRSLPAQPRPASTSPHLPPLSESPKSWRAELDPAAAPDLTEGPKSARTPGGLTAPSVLAISNSQGDRLRMEHDQLTESNPSIFGKDVQDSSPGINHRNSPKLWSQSQSQSPHILDAPEEIKKSSSDSAAHAGTAGSATYNQEGEYLVDESGVDRSGGYRQLKPKNVKTETSQALARKTSSGSLGNTVAAMRNRYTDAVRFPVSASHRCKYSLFDCRLDRRCPRRRMSLVCLSASTT